MIKEELKNQTRRRLLYSMFWKMLNLTNQLPGPSVPGL